MQRFIASETTSDMFKQLFTSTVTKVGYLLHRFGLSEDMASLLADTIVRLCALILVLLLAWLANWVAKRLLLRFVHHVAERSRTAWDDALVKHRVFLRLSHLAPGIIIYITAPIIWQGYPSITKGMQTAAILYMIAVGWFVIDAFLNAALEIYRSYEFARKIPLRGFVQVIKILLGITVLIITLSTITGNNPTTLLGGMGAMTAVLLLVFKDSILGFVAGIQLSSNRMIHIGDWIEMPKYHADGDVIDISLTTVKVQNWDKTISTIPAYALISDTFKNWRGMSESSGRRIKRNLYIDMNSIRFCDQAMLEKFAKIHYLKDYMSTRQKEINNWNKEHNIDESELVNGRRLTNVGVFRTYMINYLRNHPKIHMHMTFLVRHLEPTPKGLPLQVYVFSSDKVWANYEAIQADIFDHFLAVIPEFGLQIYQEPTGSDLKALLSSNS